MIGPMTKIFAAAVGALAGAAVAKELDKPAEERGWHGEVAGFPYDFRPPTMEKLRRTAWDPENPNVLVPHAFGVGWSINFARVAALIQPPRPEPVTARTPELPPAPTKPELAAPAAPEPPATP